jgi:heme exporter protein D
MNWQSGADFWHMGGYGLYVWGSMAVVVVLMVAEVWQVRSARAQLWAELKAQQAALDISEIE